MQRAVEKATSQQPIELDLGPAPWSLEGYMWLALHSVTGFDCLAEFLT